jgi:hypothetical protein
MEQDVCINIDFVPKMRNKSDMNAEFFTNDFEIILSRYLDEIKTNEQLTN